MNRQSTITTLLVSGLAVSLAAADVAQHPRLVKGHPVLPPAATDRNAPVIQAKGHGTEYPGGGATDRNVLIPTARGAETAATTDGYTGSSSESAGAAEASGEEAGLPITPLFLNEQELFIQAIDLRSLQPAKGLKVSVVPLDVSSYRAWTGITNSNGEFDPGWLPLGKYRALVSYPGGVLARDFELTAAEFVRLNLLVRATCYANCDGSVGKSELNVNDFICFMAKFAAGDPSANCDGSETVPILTVNDLLCFQAAFSEGCGAYSQSHD
jgi:hypothetical protein